MPGGWGAGWGQAPEPPLQLHNILRMIRNKWQSLAHGRPRRFCARLGEQTGSLRFLVDRTRALLGPTSPEYVSLMLRTAPVPGVSVRQRCRERVGWFRSRSQLYWWSNKGAVRVADAFNRGGIAVSPELQTGPLP